MTDQIRVDVLIRKRSGLYRIACFDFSNQVIIRKVLELLNESSGCPVVDVDKLLENWGVGNELSKSEA